MRRGDIYRLHLPKSAGHEQHGPRMGVVVQSDALLPRSVVLIAPTSTAARPASFRPEVSVDGVRSRVLVEQVRVLDPGGLGKLVGQVSAEEQRTIDDSLKVVFGLF